MSERRWGNFSSCCRLCLSEKLGTLKSIFEDASRSREIVKNIRICLGVEIRANDKLSTMICEQCLSKVNSWNDYRRFCTENQTKLLGWMNTWTSSNIADISIQIKDEVVEDGEEQPPPQVIVDDDDVIQVKAEPIENSYEGETLEEDIYDMPPPLTPHPPDEQVHSFMDESDDEEDDDIDQADALVTTPYLADGSETNGLVNGEEKINTPQNADARNCRMCDKVFSSAGNRRKHENMIHRRKEKNSNFLKSDVSARSKENTDCAQSKQGVNSVSGESPTRSRSISGNETEIQKIQFAAGLQLQQRSANSNQQVPIENMPLTKVEISYLEKCKVIVKMTDTLTCACHDERFEDLKDLFAHLKKQRTWFAMFTCYNCLITFGDRSSYMKHYCHCPRDLLQNLKRLSESPVNPEVKIRLYQSYKCIRCNCIFSFHEDFCSHFDVEHMEMLQDAPPYTCLCTKSFNEVEEYKQHLHITCFLRFFCDICFGVFPSVETFKAHCENEHDLAEGSTVDSYDTFHKCRLVNQEVSPPPPSTSKRSLPVDANLLKETEEDARIKRRRTVNLPVSSAPQLEPEDPDYTPAPHKVLNPHALRNVKSSKPTSCPAADCGKVYSSYHNMLRHYKLAHDQSGRILVCMYCPQKFRLISELKEHEATEHGTESDHEENVVKTPPIHRSDQLNFSCPECGDLFKSLEEWKAHMEKHPQKTCSECGKQFALQAELDQHRSAHLNIKVYRDAKTQGYKSTMVSPILICEICDKTFNTKSELRQHKLLHEKMPVLSAHDSVVEEKKDLSRKYSCTICNKHYVSYGGIWDHNKKYHSGQQIANEYPRQCDLCAKVLTSRGAWVNHQRMHERMLAQESTPKDVSEDAVSPAIQSRTPKARIMKDSDDSESYYTCKKCFKVFSSKYNLRNHMKCHGIVLNPSSRSSSKTGKIIKTYWCDVCHQACPGFSELQEHKLEHRNEKVPNQTDPAEQKKPLVFTCDICTLSFSTNFALRRHKEKHGMEPLEIKPKPMSVYCKYCKIPFENLEELNEHMTAEHDQPTAKPKQQLPKQQLQKKQPGRKFPCKLCKKVFDNAGALSSHQGWHKRGTFGKKILRSQEKVVRTMLKQIPRSSSPAETNRYQCYTCSQQFVNDTALQIHILESHRNVNATVLNCNSCKLSFESKSSYDTHMQLHKVVENQKVMKPHPCKFCSAGFSRSDTLNAHVRHHHKEHYSDIYKCNQCDRVFDKQNALTIHLKVHDRQRVSGENTPKPIHNKNIYFCSICDVGFAIAKDLRNHVVAAHPF